MKNKKVFGNKLSRQVVYKTVIGILPVLQRFSHSTGITNIDDLSCLINSMTVDEFCNFKFTDNIDSNNNDLIENGD